MRVSAKCVVKSIFLYLLFAGAIFSFFGKFINFFCGVFFQYSFFPNKKSADSLKTSHIAEKVSSEGSAFPWTYIDIVALEIFSFSASFA